MTLLRKDAFSKMCAATVAAALALQPLAAYGAAIVPALAQVPLQNVNPVKPNLMFTLDDSGSMAFEFVPDYVSYYVSLNGSGNHYFCLNQLSAAGGRVCGWATNTWGGNGSPVPQISDPPVRSSAFNRLYYDAAVNYAQGVDELRNILPYEAPGTTDTFTQVYADPYDNYVSPPGTFAPATKVNLTNTYPDTIWCWKSSTTAAQKATADIYASPPGDGSYCRRNGYAYPANALAGTAAVSAGYNYPNRSDGQSCRNVVGVFDCPTQAASTAVAPYYYTISKVQFCNTQDTSAAGVNSLSHGFGKGTCSPSPPDATLSSRWDFTTYQYVRYGTDADLVNNGHAFQPNAFTRVDIRPTGFFVNGVNTGSVSPGGRSYVQEMRNFAKWYAFYRTRITAMKTAGGLAFTVLDNTNARVGYHTIWQRAFLNVKLFDATQKSAWFTRFYNATAGGGTPLPEAMWRIGQLFSNPGAAAWTNTSGISGATDPLDPTTGQCQDNFHLLATDGYWNETLSAAHAATVGDQDKTVPAALPGPIQSDFDATPAGAFTPGTNFPKVYYEGPVATSNNLSDLAMKYWVNDLRKDFPNKVKGDYTWQKINFYGLSLGAQGNLRFTGKGNAHDLATIIAGTANWPPSPKQPPNISGTTVNDAGAEAIDDLWHATVNARGTYANANTPQELAKEIVQVLNALINQAGTATGVSLPGGQLSVSNQYGYRTTYNDTEPKDWSGDVRKYQLDLTTGALKLDGNGNLLPPVWSAKAKLDAQVSAGGTGTGWDTNRRIVTMNGATPVPFRYSQLSAAQQTSLTAGWAGVLPLPAGQTVLNFLRGDQSNEGIDVNSMRKRTHLLGDIVGAAAVPVGPPSLPYVDATNPGYSAFLASKASRSPMVYAGGNDGMLHAFIDPTIASDPTGGNEAWAYIPGALFASGDPNDTAHTPSPDLQLGALAYQVGGIPLFKHKSYVNATPRAWDVDFTNTNVSNVSGPPTSGNDWRTVLVGGLGVGGRAVYALDITDPIPATEAAAAGKVLWEFTEANLGYVYDAPTLVKTRAKGWVTLVVSGYNNPGGKGFLYVLNPKTGVLLAKVPLPGDSGTDAVPTGLSAVRAFVASRKDPYVSQAYSGDLKGNVWRFELSDPNTANWKAEKIAALTDKFGKTQPITAGIRIEIDQMTNNRYIFVGTGKLLSQTDVGSTAVWNTMYVIRDGNVTAPDPKPATPYSRATAAPNNLLSVDGTQLTGFVGTLGRGWYQDAAAANENIITDPFADLQAAVYAFARPASDPCAAVLSATLFARDFTTGVSVLEAAGGGACCIVSADIVQGIAGLTMVQAADTGNGTMPVSAQITDMAGNVYSYGINPPAGATTKHRVSWRILNN